MAPQVVIDLSKKDGVDDPPRKTQAPRSNGPNPSKPKVDRTYINSGVNELRPSYRSTSTDRRQKRPTFGDSSASNSRAAPKSQDSLSGSGANLSTKQSSGYGRQNNADRASSYSNSRTIDASSSSKNVNTLLGSASDRRKPSLPTARSSNGVSPAYSKPKGATTTPLAGSRDPLGVSKSPPNSLRVGFKRPRAEGELSTLEKLKRRKLESPADREAGRRAAHTNIAGSSLQRREGQRQNAFESLGTRKAAPSKPRQNAPYRPKITSSVIDLLSDEEGGNGAGEELLLSKPKFDAELSSKAHHEPMKYSSSSLHENTSRMIGEDQERKRNVPGRELDASASRTAARDSPVHDQRSGLPLETSNTSDIQEMRHSGEGLRKEQHSNDMTRRIDVSSDDEHSAISASAPRVPMSDEGGVPTASRKLEKLKQASTPPTLETRASTQWGTEPTKRAFEKSINGALFRERTSEPDRNSHSTAKPVFKQPKSRVAGSVTRDSSGSLTNNQSEDRSSPKAGGPNKSKAYENVLDRRGEEPKQASPSDEEAANLVKSQASSGIAQAASLSAQSKVTPSRKDAAQQELHITDPPQRRAPHDKESDPLALGLKAEIGSRPGALVASIGNTTRKANGGDASEANDGAMERSKPANLSNESESQVLPALVGKSDQAFASLSSAKQVEIIVGRYMDEVRVENEYWNKAWLRRARCSKAKTEQSADASASKPYSFAKLKPLPLIQADKKSRSQGAVKLLVEKPVPGGKSMKVPFIVQPNIIEPHDEMPSYSHFVNIKSNFLAPNVTTLQHWPYFGDDFDYSEDAKGLKEQYSFDMDQRSTKLLRLAQAQKYEHYAEDALRELGIGWSDILRYLLEVSPNVGSDPAAIEALKRRSESTSEDFCRSHTRTAQVLSSLPASTPERLAKAALTCYHFHNLAWFSLWHIARKHQFKSLPGQQHAEQTPLDDATCRICFRFACPYHGEIEELEDSDEEADPDTKKAITTDIINPPAVNNRKRVGFNPAPEGLPSNGIEPLSRKDPRHAPYWEKGFKHKADERGPFYPCHHPRQTCEGAECSCFENMVPCEKTCSCSAECARRFKGCSCSTERLKKGQRLMCYEDERCVCYSLGRECDPDLCGSCGVLEVLDPVNRECEDPMQGRCRNACIQFGRPAQTLLGQSGIHGFGLYAGQTIRQHDFVGEYKGEIITKEEAERRGAVYEKQQLSYLFTLNAFQEIDSTYFGNNIRFINHAGNGKNNLYPRIFMVNTVHRIALFADKTIQKGEELLFDYGPKFPDEQLGGKKAYQPRVRNSNMVHDFWEVEVERDATGYRRARKAAKPTGKGKARKTDAGAGEKPPKQQRGPPPGAGGRPRKNASTEEADAQSLEPDERLSAGDRLAAFNVAVEPAGEEMGFDAVNGADDEDEFEPESSGDSNSEEQDEEEDEGPGPARRSRRGRRLKARWPRD
ncbi:SET domain-containing protein [Hortaea werneckii]|nr:SET domain-containing protein [Hortaea werneckii]